MSTIKRNRILQLRFAAELLTLVFVVALGGAGAVMYISPAQAQNSMGERMTANEIHVATVGAELTEARKQADQLRNRVGELDARVSSIYGGLWAVGGICTLLQLVSMVFAKKLHLPADTSEK